MINRVKELSKTKKAVVALVIGAIIFTIGGSMIIPLLTPDIGTVKVNSTKG